MTLDTQGPTPDDAPTPPARTRWSEEGVEEDHGLTPPYIPGRATHDARNAEPAGAEAASGAEPEDEPFPFEEGVAEDEPFPFEAETPEPAEEPFPFEAETPAEEPFPFETEAGSPSPGGPEAPADPGTPTVEPEVADTAEEPFPFEAGTTATPEEPDDFPFDAFDLGDMDSGAPEGDQLSAGAAAPGGAEPVAASGGTAAELADRLEWLAQTLRTEGRAGLERELSTGDRVSAMLAGVLTGYLAGRGD